MRTITLASFVVFLLSFILYFIGVTDIAELIFDEKYYIPIARDYLKQIVPSRLDHPPLAKYFIAFGIKLFGDNPLGWRIFSVFFGSLVNVAILLFSFTLLCKSHEKREALFYSFISVIFAAFGQGLFVLSRIGMLDIFVIFFTLLALVFLFFYLWGEGRKKMLWGFSLAFGAALACKWYAVVLLIPSAYFLFKEKKLNFFKASLFLLLIPGTFYILCFMPLLLFESSNLGLWDWFSLHFKHVKGHWGASEYHRYSSTWWQWPLMLKPTWMYYKITAQKDAQMITFLMNPLLLWLGNISIVYSLGRAYFKKDQTALVFVICYFSFYLFWVLTGRDQSFQYYYALPFIFQMLSTSYMLSKLVAKLENKLRPLFLSLALLILIAPFFYFYPLLAAKGLPFQGYKDRMWLDSWGLQGDGK